MYHVDEADRIGFARRFAWDRPVPAPEGRRDTPMPRGPRAVLPPSSRRFVGRWHPRVLQLQGLEGGLGEDIPLWPSTIPAAAAPASSYQIQPTDTGGWFSDLLGKVLAPAATAYVTAKTGGIVAQAQQKTLAQTYNPAITGPAIQAQAWQQAYQQGAGVPPSGISMRTVGIAAAVVVGGLLAVKAFSGRR